MGHAKESDEVDAWIHADDEKPVDPIPETPIQKANPNYCTYKARANGEPHPDACKCVYVKNDKDVCIQLTNDCMPWETVPTSADCSAAPSAPAKEEAKGDAKDAKDEKKDEAKDAKDEKKDEKKEEKKAEEKKEEKKEEKAAPAAPATPAAPVAPVAPAAKA